jgi:hypothetical protein
MMSIKDSVSQAFLSYKVPGSPHTETLIFATGRGAEAGPHVPIDDMRDVAVRALRDGVPLTPETVVGLCGALLELDVQLETVRMQLAQARDALQAYANDLEASRADVVRAEVLRRAALDDAAQQRDISIKLSEENRALRLGSAAYRDLQARVDRAARANGSSAQVSGQWEADHDTVVQETPYGCE